MSIKQRINEVTSTRRAGVVLLLAALASTFIWVQLAGSGLTGSNGHPGTNGVNSHLSLHPLTKVSLQTSLSQPKIVQGEDGTIYLDMSITTPTLAVREVRNVPNDIIVVLDRSGSMGDGTKWPYATSAIRSLLQRLNPEDRVAFISFDSSARLESPLVPANPNNLRRLTGVLNELAPGASTNLGEALLMAESIASQSGKAYRRRVLVLSDGMANAGIVDPSQLGQIARRIADGGGVVSTVGMGLGFNEDLMAALADKGMGSFNFLEHLESMGTILAAELNDSRQLFADGSEIRLELPAGIQLVDAAGYPFEMDHRTAIIRTGQLLQESTKRFMVTLQVPAHRTTEYPLGRINLSYRHDGKPFSQRISPGAFKIACIEPERKEEAIESIDEEVFRDAWIKNNVGALQKRLGELVRSGRQQEAQEALHDYRSRLKAAEVAAPGMVKEADAQLKELESRVDDAFQGAGQKVKQNRAGKQFLQSSRKTQRADIKKN